MYHGGAKWYRIPSEPSTGKKGKTEFGVGIYTSNMYNTVIKYAKGSNIVQKLKIKKDFVDIKDVHVPNDEVFDLIKKLKIRNYKDIMSQLDSYHQRTGNNKTSLDILNNLIVNNDASYGIKSKEIVKYYISKNVDAKYISQSGDEFWILIFNPAIILSYEKVNPKQWGTDEFPFELPNIK